MRPWLTALAVLMVVLAGCSLPSDGDSSTPEPDIETTPEDVDSPDTDAPTDTATPVQNGDSGGEESTTTTTTTTDGSTDGTDADDGDTATDGGSQMVESLPDPETDRLGWEAGLWYNETIPVNNSDGMNATELQLATARAMARVEQVRQLEFPGNETIPTRVITREEFQEQGFGPRNYSEDFRTFDNVKFEALFFVGGDEDSLQVQEDNRGSSVLGYYSPANESIVLISDTGQPQIDGEQTLAQEVAHALQDQQYNLTELQDRVGTRDGYLGNLGIIEGDGNLIDSQYVDRCEADWECIPSPGSGSDTQLPEDFNWGIYFMEFVPYSDGPPFVEYYFDRGGWERIDEIYESPPASAEQVIIPEKYGSDEPVEVDLTDQTGNGWERVRPEPQQSASIQPDYDRLGMGSLSAMFMRTAFDDYNDSALVTRFEFITGDRSDPIDYAFDFTTGWEGDRLHVYENAETGETGYVWRLVWESPEDAQQFTDKYEDLLQYWDGKSAGNSRWVIPEESPFTGALSVTTEGDTVTIVKAPTTEDLGDVYEPAG